jgi:hypothetical protein
MSLIEKIPHLDDSSLKNLFDNAQRLEATGTPAQQTAAAELLPALAKALSERKAVKLEAAAAKRAALPPRVTKPRKKKADVAAEAAAD